MIHGDAVSIGCLAMGDKAAEDLFVLASDTGLENIKVILTPVDFRKRDLSEAETTNLPDWHVELYNDVKKELNILPDN